MKNYLVYIVIAALIVIAAFFVYKKMYASIPLIQPQEQEAAMGATQATRGAFFQE